MNKGTFSRKMRLQENGFASLIKKTISVVSKCQIGVPGKKTFYFSSVPSTAQVGGVKLKSMKHSDSFTFSPTEMEELLFISSILFHST